MTKVALSGASGNVGRILREELPKRGVDLRSAGGSKPLQPLHEGEDVMHGDLREPAVVEDQIVPRDMITLSLTFDHRIVDGAPAAHFLATLRGCLEQPAAWLI